MALNIADACMYEEIENDNRDDQFSEAMLAEWRKKSETVTVVDDANFPVLKPAGMEELKKQVKVAQAPAKKGRKSL